MLRPCLEVSGDRMSAQGAINVRSNVFDLQSKLFHAAKSRF